MRVFLIRHPRPAIEPGICYGRLDIDAIDDDTPACAARLAAQLAAAGVSADIVLAASPARRCRGLAEALAAALGLRPHYAADLLEKSFGDWEGRRWDDIDPAQIDAWAADVLHFVPPASATLPGESVAAMAARVRACVAALTQNAAGDLVIVAHAGVMRALLGDWLALPLAEWSTLKLDFGALTRVDFVAEATDGSAKDAASARKGVLHTLNG